MNEYEAKQEARRERYLDLADRAEQESDSAYHRARELGQMIPPGQPILVDHYSAPRHRAHLKRMDNAMRKSCEATDKAKHYRSKAAGVGTAGISSDDPDALTKLREKLARLEENQTMYKAINRIIRSKPRDEMTDEKLAKLRDLGLSEKAAAAAFEPDFCGRIGIPSYSLSNNNANIRRIKERIARLDAPEKPPVSKSFDGIEYREEGNRVRLIFPGKPPAETRKTLKSNGFRWSPMAGAWQRHRNNAGRYAAKRVLSELGAT